MNIATWNVNSLKVRLPQVIDFINNNPIDILALQELKMDQPLVPVEQFEEHGFYCVSAGQKTYNGVAFISRMPLHEIQTDFPDFIDPQRRLIAATIGDVRIVNVYCVCGDYVGGEKFAYKTQWFAALIRFLRAELAKYPKLIVLGDFNIAPEARDLHDPLAYQTLLFSETEQKIFKEIIELGLVDSFRLFNQEEKQFSWWDYRAKMFQRNMGVRIDLILISEALKTACIGSEIDKRPRKHERPSDHTPVIASFNW